MSALREGAGQNLVGQPHDPVDLGKTPPMHRHLEEDWPTVPGSRCARLDGLPPSRRWWRRALRTKERQIQARAVLQEGRG